MSKSVEDKINNTLSDMSKSKFIISEGQLGSGMSLFSAYMAYAMQKLMGKKVIHCNNEFGIPYTKFDLDNFKADQLHSKGIKIKGKSK